MLCKIWGFHGGDYEEFRLLGCKKPVRTSQETHYFSAIEPRRLMLCQVGGFHGGDYEECRLLGYKRPVLTSQETHSISATEPIRLMLWKNWGLHGGDSEEGRLLGCDDGWLLWETTFRRKVSPSWSIYYFNAYFLKQWLNLRNVLRLLATANVSLVR
jgi:hypothetical protein